MGTRRQGTTPTPGGRQRSFVKTQADILYRWKLRQSTSNCLGTFSPTGTGSGKGTTGLVWRTLKPTEPGFGTTQESRQTLSCGPTEPGLNPTNSVSILTMTHTGNGSHHNTVKYSALCEADPKFRWPRPTPPTTQPFTPSGGYTDRRPAADEAGKDLDWAAGLGA